MKERYFRQPPSNQSHFASVPHAEIERSTFDRSHAHKTTFDGGYLIPVYVDEVLPGDTFTMQSTAFARLATPLKPVMDNIYLDTHYFFVPYRLCWDNWQRFMGERKDPTDTSGDDLTIPQAIVTEDELGPNMLAQYMGIPFTGSGGIYAFSALPFRAYGLIWNEFYRDQNLQQPLPVLTGDEPAVLANIMPQRRGKRHDYFTSCLPWPQKGDPVYIPLATNAEVVSDGTTPKLTGVVEDGPGHNLQLITHETVPMVGLVGSILSENDAAIWTNTGMMADLTTATALTINDLRTAFQIQRLLERDARGGTRYIELVLAHFGVHSDDARLQRPEYLGGGTTMVTVSPVAQTVPVETVSPQGNLAAVGTAVGKAGFTKSFTEHGVIIGLVSARADLTYQYGLERMWSRQTRYDFYWPALAHLGEQAVLNREIFFHGNNSPGFDLDVFGYQERFAEYRYKPSRISGLFNSAQPTSLDVWHLAQDFGSAAPPLNGPFIHEDPPFDRVIAVQDEPHFLLDMWFDLKCQRPMPVYSVPGLIDHF